jgi:hypothetical protein
MVIKEEGYIRYRFFNSQEQHFTARIGHLASKNKPIYIYMGRQKAINSAPIGKLLTS